MIILLKVYCSYCFVLQGWQFFKEPLNNERKRKKERQRQRETETETKTKIERERERERS